MTARRVAGSPGNSWRASSRVHRTEQVVRGVPIRAYSCVRNSRFDGVVGRQRATSVVVGVAGVGHAIHAIEGGCGGGWTGSRACSVGGCWRCVNASPV
jgi:hypothetical protein